MKFKKGDVVELHPKHIQRYKVTDLRLKVKGIIKHVRHVSHCTFYTVWWEGYGYSFNFEESLTLPNKLQTTIATNYVI